MILAAGSAAATQEQLNAPAPPPVAPRLIPPEEKVAKLFPLTPEEEKLLPALKKIIRDNEGFYPFSYRDPKNFPVVGAAFNLDTEEMIYPEDGAFRFNGRMRKDPSADQLIEAAGANIDADLLRESAKKHYTVKMKLMGSGMLDPPEGSRISEQDGEKLLDISARQALHNGGAYFRHWHSFTDGQKLAFADMIYQIGTRLPGFKNMLAAANGEAPLTAQNWKIIREHAQNSEWHQTYTTRAQQAVAMMDPKHKLPRHVNMLIAARHSSPDAPSASTPRRP